MVISHEVIIISYAEHPNRDAYKESECMLKPSPTQSNI